MKSSSPPAVTLKAVAQRAGVSLATVSYALRKDPKISRKTRDVVLQAADNLGYRPNPRVAGLMAHIRGSRSGSAQECLAFVWVNTSRRTAREDPFLRSVLAGARERAGQLGFRLEEFWAADEGMTDVRLEKILRARGIVGVILSPVIAAEVTLTMNWNWRHFAAAVIGNVTWSPELHHAGHHHFLGMRLALQELGKLGAVRPAALIEKTASERSKHAWEAAFLTHHRDTQSARELIRVADTGDHGQIVEWLRRTQADGLLVGGNTFLQIPALLPACRRLGLRVFTLHWDSSTPPGIGGVDQCYDRVAGHAVDLVASQLNANETGVPDLPCLMLFPGRWVAAGSGVSARKRQVAALSSGPARR